MTAIQVLRNRAQAAGTLKSTPQQKVEVQPAPPAPEGSTQPALQQTIIIQPAQPNTVYVPQYNPTTAYGAPVPAPAGYSGTDLLLTGVLSFGAGMLIGSLINDGHNNWGMNWGGGYNNSVSYNRNVYVSNNNIYRGRYPNGGYPNRGYPGNRPPGYGGGGQHPRPGQLPAGRPPYNGGGNRPYNPGNPATRPYNPANARPNPAKNPNMPKAPNFPKASTLPKNTELGNLNKNNLAQNRPSQRDNPTAASRPAANKPANRAADPARGLAKGTILPVGAAERWADISRVALHGLPVPEAKLVSAETRAAGTDSGAEAVIMAVVAGIVAAVVGRRSAAVVAAAIAAAADVEADEALHELLTRHSLTTGNEIRLPHAGNRDS